jgi:hypothetical protein
MDVEKENIVSKVTSTHENHIKTAHQWVKDLDLGCLDTTFIHVMYKHRLHHLPGGEKPKLNPRCMHKRNELTKQLLEMDFRQNVFINKANKRSEYGMKKC